MQVKDIQPRLIAPPGHGETGEGATSAKERWFSGATASALLIVSCAIGVAVVAVAFAGARSGQDWAVVLFWTGLLIIVLPVALRLIGAEASRMERLGLVMLLALSLYLVMVLLSPNSFELHDELGAYRSVADILRTGQLYVTNPVDAAYSSYPAIMIVTAALSRLSGVGIFPCGLVLVAVAKLLLTGGLFLFVERVARSARVAGIAVLIYVANPNFFFFDSQFAYESLALGLAAMGLWLTARVADDKEGSWTDAAVLAILDSALVLTHHLTSYALALVIIAWAAIDLIRRKLTPGTKRLAILALYALVITAAYAVFAFKATESDIGTSITGSFHGLFQILSGAASGKTPFSAAVGYSDPALEQAVGLASVALLLAAWPFGLYVVWRRRWPQTGLLLLAIGAFLYPATLALRLTSAGNETSNRTSEFVFVGLATILALTFVTMLARRVDAHDWRALGLRIAATVYLGLVFVGGITVGMPSYDVLPARYEVAADSRSVDAEGVDAARWAGRWLIPGSYFLADENDSELFTAYSQLHQQSGTVQGKPIGDVIVSLTVGPRQIRTIRVDKLRYLIVDTRDSTALPHSGHYFEGSDPESYSSPLAIQALTKFNGNRCFDRVYSSGHIVIYDTEKVLAGCR